MRERKRNRDRRRERRWGKKKESKEGKIRNRLILRNVNSYLGWFLAHHRHVHIYTRNDNIGTLKRN